MNSFQYIYIYIYGYKTLYSWYNYFTVTSGFPVTYSPFSFPLPILIAFLASLCKLHFAKLFILKIDADRLHSWHSSWIVVQGFLFLGTKTGHRADSHRLQHRTHPSYKKLGSVFLFEIHLIRPMICSFMKSYYADGTVFSFEIEENCFALSNIEMKNG